MKRQQRGGPAKAGLVFEPGDQENDNQQRHQNGPRLPAGRPRVEHRAKRGEQREHAQISESFGERAPTFQRLAQGGGLREQA